MQNAKWLFGLPWLKQCQRIFLSLWSQMHRDVAKEAIRVFILDAFGEMPCRVCLEKVLDPPVYTVTKWVKSPEHGPLLVRSHRFCPLFCRWGRWIYQPPELRSFLSMFSCDVTICFLIFAWILCAKFVIRKDDVRVTTISFWNFAAFASSVQIYDTKNLYNKRICRNLTRV